VVPDVKRTNSGWLNGKRGHGAPAAIDEVHAHERELLVPRREPGKRGGISRALLEEPIPPGEELAELNQRRDVHRKEASREAIDEAAPGDGRAVHDVEVLPAERDRACPLDRFAARLPVPIVESFNRPPKRPARLGGRVGTDEIPRERGRLGAPVRDVGSPGRSE